jgi:hypothetical protein
MYAATAIKMLDRDMLESPVADFDGAAGIAATMATIRAGTHGFNDYHGVAKRAQCGHYGLTSSAKLPSPFPRDQDMNPMKKILRRGAKELQIFVLCDGTR